MKTRILLSALFVSFIAFTGQAQAQSAASANDEATVASVKAALAAKPELHSEKLQISSKNGEVTIAGIVESGPQLYAVADTAQKVAGVKWVNNEMSVKK